MVAPKVTHKNKLEVVANPRREKGVSPIQDRFCQLYVTREDLTQSQCAVEAGYSNRSAHSKASELLNPNRWPNVTVRIRELKLELGRKYGKIDQMSREEVMRAINELQKDFPALKEVEVEFEVIKEG